MPTLIEISEDLMALDRLFEDSADETGEVPPEAAAELDAWLAELMHDRDRKLDNYGALIREYELRAAARKEEMERLAMRVKVDENRVKFLKQRLREFLDAHNTPKIETRRYKFSCRNNGGLQPMELPENPEVLPEEYQKVVVSADTEKIREALKANTDVPFCRLLPRGRHLRIT